MTNNETLRLIQAALKLEPGDVARIFQAAGHIPGTADQTGYFLDPSEEGYVPCPNIALAAFLEGLIIDRRGPNPKKPGPPQLTDSALDNSDVLKKLRIALDMLHTDVVATLARVGVNPTKSDVADWFRAKGHVQYRSASDAVLRYFLTGWRPPRRPRIVR